MRSRYLAIAALLLVTCVLCRFVILPVDLTEGRRDGAGVEQRMLASSTDGNAASVAGSLPRELHGALQDNPALVEFARHRINPPSPGPLLLSKDLVHYSQIGQSQVVDEVLQEMENGFFIECGAGDGERFSNSLFFEMRRNWTGLLIEANPSNFERIVSKKRKAHTVNGCLSPTRTASVMNFTFAKWLGGLSSHMDESHMTILEETGRIRGNQEVTCVPLFTLLLALNVSHVDYFSLDVEGPELDILETLPFDAVVMDVISVEFGVIGCEECAHEKLQKLDDFFAGLGNYRRERTIGSQDAVYRRIGLV